MTTTDLIVNFPSLQQRRHRRTVRFVDEAEIKVVERHEDNEENKVARHELWYTKAEYDLMKLNIKDDVLEVRAMASASEGGSFNYSGGGDCDGDDDVCCIGIEHLLTPACALGVRNCRMRCIYAVLAEQTRQGPSSRFRWEAIAVASISQTRWAALRGRKLGKLHRDSTI